jgi:hypothetical protein
MKAWLAAAAAAAICPSQYARLLLVNFFHVLHHCCDVAHAGTAMQHSLGMACVCTACSYVVGGPARLLFRQAGAPAL